MLNLLAAAVATGGTAMLNGDTAIADGGTNPGDDVVFCGVSTDSRSIGAGELFVALAGDRFDGHAFLPQARARGAVAAMVDADRADSLLPLGLPLLAVADTRRGLGQLAAHWRRQFSLPLIAVTGSNGKTTVKEMIASILRAHAAADGDDPELAVLATRGNLNNDIGLPLTLLRLRQTHRAGVVELGMNRPGEIAYLTDIAAPTVSVVTNAHRAHVEGLGSLAAIAREKGALIEHAGSDAVAVINADDPNVAVWRQMAGRRRQISFALDTAADVCGRCVDSGFGTRLHLVTMAGVADVTLRVPGRHNARNATAAAAAALSAGLDLAAVVAGLDAYRAQKGRLQALPAEGGATVLDDTYNANPDSVRAGLDVLERVSGQRLMVFGDMGETGAEAPRFHEEVGLYARQLGIDRLFTFGEASALATRAFGTGAAHFAELPALLAALRRCLTPTTTVLVKGSRFMKMERVVDALCDNLDNVAPTGEKQRCC